MKHGTFYLLPQKYQKNELKNTEQYIYKLTSSEWRSGKTILITCNNKYQAITINKILWVFDKNSFLPHNLFTQGIHNSPITIFWDQCYYDYKSRNLLINLMERSMHFFFDFEEIIDFVPATDTLKKLARNRYRSYKKYGFKLRVKNISTI